jgi:hypothetical protein
MMRVLRTVALFALGFVCPSGTAGAAIAVAVEYYDAALDHYFVTSIPAEIAALDGGAFPGWIRTGLSFNVYATGSGIAGSTPVCRFYGSPAAGLNSHFYSGSPVECQEVLQRFSDAWLLESYDVFEVFLPDLTTGACPGGSVPIYRAWNQRGDSNHRYTTDLSVLQAMVAKGYVAEGYGPVAAPTAMCSPTGGGVGVPVCSPTKSNPFPYVGSTVTLFANCTGDPTGYVWTGCSSSGGRCMATSAVAGTLTYTVTASNGSGTGAPSSLNVTWLNLPPPPACSMIVTTNTVPPVAGSLALLDAACTNLPTSYTWTNCFSGTNICDTYGDTAGIKAYSVSASNAGGTSPSALVNIDWQSMPPVPPGFCGAFPSYLFTDDGWAGTRLITSLFTDPPGFAADGAWVVKFTVPPDASSTRLGRFDVAEYNGPATSRHMTLSRVPCDFRAVDPTGSNGPLAADFDSSVHINFQLGSSSTIGVAGLVPGETYYVNVRNWQPETSSVSCTQARCDAFMDVTLP